MKMILKLSLVGFALLGSMVQACTLEGWTANSGMVAVGGPDELGFPRLSGICAMQATGTGSVRDETPSAEAQIRIRFYFLPEGTATGSTDILVAASDDAGSNAIFTISYNGANVTATSNDGGSNATAAVGSTSWHLIEVNWIAGGAMELWVDSDASSVTADATGSSGDAMSTIESVTLGVIGGLDTQKGGLSATYFDEYESRRTSAVGMKLACDANGDGAVNVGDIVTIRNEILGAGSSTGQADCNLDAGVNVGDIVATRNIILGL